MCGIAGIVRFDGSRVSLDEVTMMTDALAHRGPDGEGQWAEDGVGLGHRRLAILDPSPAGSQPMQSADGRYVITYNGEVYNFKEIRSELERSGVRSRTGTDTEVVLNALATWGTFAVCRFNGMFALALWDRVSRTLLLARDRYGIKPLYYSFSTGEVVFASECKAMAALPGHSVHLDTNALIEYMTFQNIFSERTFAKGMKLLPPGHVAVVDTASASPTMALTKYWDFAFRNPPGDPDPREYEEELDRLMAQAVKRSLVSDVEVGAYLSGGVDSGSITAIASQSLKGMKTFTCGFDLSSASGLELAFDERAHAEAMSAHFRTEQYEMVLKAGDMEQSLPSLVWHLEEPRVGQSYPNYYAAKLAAGLVKVVLSGAGGDELFGGYPWRYFTPDNAPSLDAYAREYFLSWQRLLDGPSLDDLVAPMRHGITGVSTFDIFRDVFASVEFGDSSPADLVNLSLYFECKTFLHGLLVVEDKLSMAHGLETRLPFLDNDLVDFATTCPVSLKLRNLSHRVPLDENSIGNKNDIYFRRTNDGKRILRQVMARHVPVEAIQRKKQGFSAPDASWFRGESIDFVRRALLSPQARINDVFDPTTTRRLVEEHLSGQRNRRLLLWSLLSVEQWLHTFG